MKTLKILLASSINWQNSLLGCNNEGAVLYGRKDIRYDEIEMPVIKKDEILVKVNVTGICGSDLPGVLGDAAHYYPIVLGMNSPVKW